MSRKSVNDARRRFAEFDRACSTALARARRGLQAIAYERAVVGREMVVIRDGKEVERRIMPSDAMLGLLIKRGELGPGEGGRSEEHTSELKSLMRISYAVFCLKKKNKTTEIISILTSYTT